MAVITDTIEEFEAQEIEGNVVSLRRRFLLTGGSYGSALLLWEALASPYIPSAGAFAPGNTNLVCTGRRVKLLPNSNRQVEVTCDYVPLGQSASGFIFSGSTSLAQAESQLDRYGNQISVSHTWPGDDPDFPSKTHLQGLNMSVLMPQSTLTARGQLQVQWPDYVSELWTGAMNATWWAGTAPYYYMCTKVDWEPLDVGVGRNRWWGFTFEFQKAATGWIPQTWFIDQRTGKPPANLVPGVGYKNVDWYNVLDYNVLFPIR